MSWAVTFIGKPDKVAEALDAYSEQLSGPSKEEYDKTKINIIGLVKQNFGHERQSVRVSAQGHGYILNGVPQDSSCSVTIESHYGEVV